MPVSLEQFAKSLYVSGLMTAEEIKVFHSSLPQEKRRDVPQFATELVRRGKLTKYQAATIYNGGASSLTMGDYRILDKIGAGGMGQVFKAEHRRMKRVVALKLLPAEVIKDAHTVKRFQREVETAARLIHPNIVTAYDAGEHQGIHYLIMEFVDGQDLANLVKKQGTLSIETAVDFLLQAARGLEHAHAEGVIHRDIKPANLLVDKKGVVKILDMGLARVEGALSSRDVAASVEGLTNSGVMMGTVDYMAPEQAVDTHQADHRADIYSLGCTLFYLLAGRKMYEGETLMKRILAHREQPIPPLSNFRPDLPASLETIFQRMVAKRPEERYQAVAAVRQALEQCQAKLENSSDSSVLLVEHVVDVDLASFLKGMRSSSGPAMATQQLRTTETLVNSGDLETRPDSQSQSKSSVSAVLRPRRRWMAGAAAMGLLVAVSIAALAWVNRPVTKLPVTKLPDDSPQQANAGTSLSPGALKELPPEVAPAPAPAPEPTTKTFAPLPPLLLPVPEKPISPPLTPAANPPDPPPAKPSKPDEPTVSGPKTIVVGPEQGQVRNLARALELATAGDTILIRHRGPLQMPPLDLTGKSPLIIAGDTADGVDFWPLIVQGVPKDENDQPQPGPGEAPGFFFGKQADLTLKRVHLAVGGAASQQIKTGAVFALSGGRVRVEECSITVGSENGPGDAPGNKIPFVQGISPDERLEFSLTRSYVRGPRLAGCVSAAGGGELQLSLDQTLWAGAAAPWLTAIDPAGRWKINITQSTLYNLTSLLHWEGAAPAAKPSASIAASRSLFVSAYNNKAPLVNVNAGDAQIDLASLAAGGVLSWHGESNVFHRFEGYYREPRVKTLATLTKWRTLWGQSGSALDRESDPHFRVWPAEYLLQEAHAWDFEPRFWRNREKTRQIAEEIGAPVGLPALPRSLGRPQAPADLAGKPRGTPRVLRVHQKDGPYKTIEAALAEAREGDIVEIADNGPYMPRRNFTINPGDGVLVSGVDSLSIRAARETSPVIVLRDEFQEGTPNTSHMGNWLVYLAATNRSSLVIDGLHFRMAASATPHRALAAVRELAVLRVSNCSFAMPLPTAALYFTSAPQVVWLESSAFLNSAAKYEEEFVHLHSMQHLDNSVCLFAARNCLFNAPALGQYIGSSDPKRKLNLSLHGNTFLGRIGKLEKTGALATDCSENLVVSAEAAFKFDDDAVWRNAAKQGDRNALWIGARALTEQERGEFTNSLLPGPPLKTHPIDTSTASRDPWRRFRPKRTTVLAADGANVGVRFEYLPEVPPES